MVRLEGLVEPQADPALGRPAPARRARPGARQPPDGAAARRAARRAGPQAAPGDAARAQAHPGRDRRRDHVRLRDPRPGGGADDERSRRRVLQRPPRADRHAGRDLRAPGQRVRRRLRRHVERLRARRHALHDPPREDRRPSATTVRRRRAAIAETGTVSEVIYLGAVTRYVVDLCTTARRCPSCARTPNAGAEHALHRAWPSLATDMADRPDVRPQPPTPEEKDSPVMRQHSDHRRDRSCSRPSRGSSRPAAAAAHREQLHDERQTRCRRSARARASSTSSPGRATPSPSGSSRSRSRPAARSTPSTAAPPTRWSR